MFSPWILARGSFPGKRRLRKVRHSLAVDGLESRQLLSSILVSPKAGLQTSENGGSAVISVFLSSAPTQNVTVRLASSNPKLGTLSANAVVFTPANYNKPQSVRITGQMDDQVSHNAYYQITGTSASADPHFSGLVLPAVTIKSIHPRGLAPGVSVSPTSGLSTTKDGGTAQFRVRLTEKPQAPVTIPISSSNTKEGNPSVGFLVFTPANWSAAQTVTVTGVDDGAFGSVKYSIRVGPAQSLDRAYAGKQGATVSLTNKDKTGIDRFNGTYTGSYSGTASYDGFVVPVSGAVSFTVLNGVITVTAPEPGRGTLTAKGDASFGTAGGALNGATFSGVFFAAPGKKPYASGSWSYSLDGAVGQGGWTTQ